MANKNAPVIADSLPDYKGDKRFFKGQRIGFWATYKGKKYSLIKGIAQEDGETGMARRVIIRIKPGLVRVPCNQIYMVFSEPVTE